MKRTRVCELLGIEYPIVQAPMLWISWAELVAAVSNAGGLGTLGVNSGAAAPTKDLEVLRERLREQIRQVRSLTPKPFAVNVLAPAQGADPYSNKFVEVMIEERVPIAAVAGENPRLYTERLKKAGIKVLHRPINPTVKTAREAQEAGADAVVIVGFDGGGELGFDMLSTFVIVPQVVEALKIPVIAGGGVADARGIVAAFALGAEGVYMGTRFIATHECQAHPHFKRAVVEATDTSTVIIKLPMSFVRCMKSPLAEQGLEMQARGVPMAEIQKKVFAGKAKPALFDGDLTNGVGFFSPSAGLIKEVVSVRDLIASLVADYDRIKAGL